MEQKLFETDIETFDCNVFQVFGGATPLLTAGNRFRMNTMTIGWGGLGTLWGKPVCTVYVRPERYTYDFMEKSDYYTVSAFSELYREHMKFCGQKSGRDVDKIDACHLTPCFGAGDAPYFAEADLVLVCKKLFKQDLAEASAGGNEDILKYYGAQGNWHRMYVGEVVQILRK